LIGGHARFEVSVDDAKTLGYGQRVGFPCCTQNRDAGGAFSENGRAVANESRIVDLPGRLEAETREAVFTYFAEAGAFVFGSGLAIVPFLYGGVVGDFHWLTERQFLDAVAVAMITPGPVVITVSFIGFLIAGFPGAVVAGIGTFLPCYLFTVVPAPYFKKHGKRPDILAVVEGVTAAAIGAITGAVIVLGRRSVVDVPTAVICVATVGVLWYS